MSLTSENVDRLLLTRLFTERPSTDLDHRGRYWPGCVVVTGGFGWAIDAYKPSSFQIQWRGTRVEETNENA